MAKLAPVKCPYCGQSFQRENTEFVQLGRRYAHKECADIVKQIHDYMQHKLGEGYSKTKVESQIKNFVSKEGMSIDAIYKTLIYWYDIKKSSTDQANGGIGIVPYVYKDATEYWTNIEWKKHGFMQAVEEQIFERANREVIKIKRPTTKKKKSKYDLNLIEGAEEDDS